MNRDIEIYKRRMNGESGTSLAREYRLCKSRITAICKEQAALVAGGADLPARLEAAKFELLKWRAINEELGATLAGLRLKVERGELLPRSEVRETFSRVFAPFRQATREIDRRYGPDAARLLIAAERSALTREE